MVSQTGGLKLLNCPNIIKLVAVVACFAPAACHKSPADKEAQYMKRGEAEMAKKDYQRAILEFRNAAQVMPNDAEPYYRLGLAYLEVPDPRNAYGALKKATELNPHHNEAQLKLSQVLLATRDKA